MGRKHFKEYQGKGVLTKKGNLKSLDEAFYNFSTCCNNDSDSCDFLFMRGRCYMAYGDFKRAMYDFSAAIR